MNKFIILEEERERILNMHKSRTSELYLNEQIGGAGPAPRPFNEETLGLACTTWGNMDDAAKKEFTDYTIKQIGTGYPYNMNIACATTTFDENDYNDKDREIIHNLLDTYGDRFGA